MHKSHETPPKPPPERRGPGTTRLPPLTRRRRFARRFWVWASRLLIWLFTRPVIRGLQNFPAQGPALMVINHLGDADAVLGLAALPIPPDALAKVELYDYPVLGKLLDAYGVIWVHRGAPDRRALRAALQALEQGRIVAIAPEGRESPTGALEEAQGGAAYLAWKSGAPVLPVAFTGTENWRIYPNLKRLRRTQVSMTVGPLFSLTSNPDHQAAIRQGTEAIMLALAAQLPEAYRGEYASAFEEREG